MPQFGKNDGVFVERGRTVDQDGKNNVWAVEPRMKVEEKGPNWLLFGGVATTFVAGAAAIVVNLP